VYVHRTRATRGCRASEHREIGPDLSDVVAATVDVSRIEDAMDKATLI
jgi:hypothetical protein